jgi:hypothetical protein
VREKILAAHAPAKLSLEDAERLAISPPVIASLVSNGLLTYTKCLKATAEPLNNADEVWLDLGCSEDAPEVRLSVNDVTGVIRVLDSDVTLDSPNLRKARDAATGGAVDRKMAARDEVRRECH